MDAFQNAPPTTTAEFALPGDRLQRATPGPTAEPFPSMDAFQNTPPTTTAEFAAPARRPRRAAGGGTGFGSANFMWRART